MQETPASAMRSAALQALASLQKVVTDVTGELDRITRVIDATATPEALATDPESPEQMRRALAMAKTELAAAREALAPFAHAWSKKMELIADTEVTVFVDPLRADRSRTITLGDLRRAARAYQSMTVGIDLLERLYRAEAILQKLVELREWVVQVVKVRETNLAEFLARFQNLVNESTQHLAHRTPGPQEKDADAPLPPNPDT